MNGWIKIHLKFLKWEWFQDPKMVQLFLYLLLSANWKKTRWQGIVLDPGQVVVGRKALSKYLNISEQTVRTLITRLKSTNEITIQSTNRFSIITIIKWLDYQKIEECPTNKSTTNPPNKQPTTNQQLTTAKDIKNIRSKDSIGRFAPPTPEEVKNYCLERDNGVDCDKWYNFYSAKGWLIGKNKMKDWRAAVRTWEVKKIAPVYKEMPKEEEITEDQRKANLDKINQLRNTLNFKM
jgi:hypothetical protein